MTRRKVVALLGLAVGLLLLAYMVRAVGVADLRAELGKVRAVLPYLTLPYFFVYVFDTLGWYYCFGARKPSIPFPRLFAIRVGGEAISNVIPSAYVAGEPVKVMLLGTTGYPAEEALASVVIAKTMMTVAQSLFVLSGLVVVAAGGNLDAGLAKGLVVMLAGLSAGVGGFIVLQRRGLFRSILRLAALVPSLGKKLEPRRARLLVIDGMMADFYGKRRGDFVLSLLFFFLGWLAGAPEVMLMLGAMGHPVTPLQAISIESLVTIIKGAAWIVPGSVGAQEAGTVAVLALFGISAGPGLSLSLLRRAREIAWVTFGLSSVLVLSPRKTPAQ